MIIRKSALPEDHYRYYPGAEDYDLWVRVARNARVWNLQRVLVKYRIHPNSISFVNSSNIEIYVREIMRTQLESINIKPAEREMNIHRSMAKFTCASDESFIKETEDWLGKLYEANKHVKYFKSPFFEYCLMEQYLSVCRRSVGIFYPFWYLLCSSQLGGLSRADFKMKGAFIVRFLFNMAKYSIIQPRFKIIRSKLRHR